MRNTNKLITDIREQTDNLDMLLTYANSLSSAISVDHSENLSTDGEGGFTYSDDIADGLLALNDYLIEQVKQVHRQRDDHIYELIQAHKAQTEALNAYKLAECERKAVEVAKDE
ncbi:hypothetical protein NYR60_06490 [Actinobacillus genomosp. 2]|uniref:hypothetical protein n=1 Tax=Actinobacillus genomosp. 2 TaxID=230709 RepID=UPI002441B108|nr:hypothetical protein [Actinobacillus genomosp. 2]WGE31509.1 hypothetical protein NYR60_06490 [Actinobacillus genomosp. 2]